MEDMRIGKHKPRTQLVTCAPADTRILVKALGMVETWNSLGTERKRERGEFQERNVRWDDRAHTAATLINIGQRKPSYQGPSHTLTKRHCTLGKNKRAG